MQTQGPEHLSPDSRLAVIPKTGEKTESSIKNPAADPWETNDRGLPLSQLPTAVGSTNGQEPGHLTQAPARCQPPDWGDLEFGRCGGGWGSFYKKFSTRNIIPAQKGRWLQ